MPYHKVPYIAHFELEKLVAKQRRHERFPLTVRRIAEQAHDSQVDKAGNPYLGHVHRVASYVDHTNHHAIAAALLHDTIEDSDINASTLADAGIPPEVIHVVILLTRRDEQPPHEYYAAIRNHPLALEVKLGDIADNTDPDRLAQLPPDRQAKLIHKYTDAYVALGADFADGHRRRVKPRPA